MTASVELNDKEIIVASTLAMTLEKSRMSTEELFEEIGIDRLVEKLPQHVWNVIHMSMLAVKAAPEAKVAAPAVGVSEHTTAHQTVLEKLLNESLGRILDHDQLLESIGTENLIRNFPIEVWTAVSKALDFSIEEEEEVVPAPEVETEPDEEEEAEPEPEAEPDQNGA